MTEVRHRGWGRHRQRGRCIQGRYVQWALYLPLPWGHFEVSWWMTLLVYWFCQPLWRDLPDRWIEHLLGAARGRGSLGGSLEPCKKIFYIHLEKKTLLSNQWWIRNSVSKDFDTAMRADSSGWYPIAYTKFHPAKKCSKVGSPRRLFDTKLLSV